MLGQLGPMKKRDLKGTTKLKGGEGTAARLHANRVDMNAVPAHFICCMNEWRNLRNSLNDVNLCF